MDFGHTTDIAHIDFSLPADHASNAEFLKSAGAFRQAQRPAFRLHAGCAKWGIKEWVGTLYPAGTTESEYLYKYSRCFNSVELNTTGYRFGSARRMAEWAAQTPEGFSFSPKFPQIITQFKLLGDVQEQTDRFVESISGFGDRMGMPFLLLPERFTPARIDKVEAFIEKIPEGFSVAFEFRHPEFYTEENIQRLAEILRRHNAPWIITDSAGERGVIHQVLTSDTVFIRFSGCDHQDVDEHRMDDWVDRITSWREMGVREVYWYAHNIPEVKTPEYATYFTKRFNEKLDSVME
jgi:uncharacterized protein YecE (DUF72 family)